MQVVKPSVPLAAVLHGMAFTVFVEIPSSPTLSKPVLIPGNHGVPSEGATPVIGGGAVTVGGGPPIDPGACCANADNDERARAAATEDVVLPKRIETSFELQQQLHKTPNVEIHRPAVLHPARAAEFWLGSVPEKFAKLFRNSGLCGCAATALAQFGQAEIVATP